MSLYWLFSIVALARLMSSNDYLCTGTPYTTNKSKNTHWNYRNSQWQNQAVAFAINRLKSGDNLNL